MIGRLLALLVCLFAVILPWRLRVGFANLLGWFLQGVYWVYARLMQRLIRSLGPKPGKGAS